MFFVVSDYGGGSKTKGNQNKTGLKIFNPPPHPKKKEP